jgi:hypothetical protein
VDDNPWDDKTPATVTGLAAGKHVVKLDLGDAYNPVNFEVDVQKGVVEKLNTKTLGLKEVEITFVSEPAGAKVVLQSEKTSKNVGVTPCSSVIDTTKAYEVAYTLDGFEKVERPLEESEYQTGKEKVELALVTLEKSAVAEKAPSKGTKSTKATTSGGGGGAKGMLSVQTRPWAKVFIDNKFIRNTPLVNYPLKPGSYTVTVENPSFNIRRSFRVRITSGQTTTLVKQLI